VSSDALAQACIVLRHHKGFPGMHSPSISAPALAGDWIASPTCSGQSVHIDFFFNFNAFLLPLENSTHPIITKRPVIIKGKMKSLLRI